MKVKILFLFLLFTSCMLSKEKHAVFINNTSALTIDSIVIRVNNYTTTIGTVNPGQKIEKPIARDSIIAKHDVIYSFTVFAKGAVKSRETFFSNDLSYVPPRFKVRITDSLKLVIEP